MYKKYVNRSKKEINELALDLFKGSIFTSNQIRANDQSLLLSIFMPLVFMKKEYIDWMQDNKISVFYEYWDQAGPRSINGYPIFFSMKMMDEKDAKIVWEKCEAIVKAVDDEQEKIPEGQMDLLD